MNLNVNELLDPPVIESVNLLIGSANLTIPIADTATGRPSVATTKCLRQANLCIPLNISNEFTRDSHDYNKVLNPIDD